MMYFDARYLRNIRSGGTKQEHGFSHFRLVFGGKRVFCRDTVAVKTKNRLSISKRGDLRMYLTILSPNIKELAKAHPAHPSH